MSEQIQGDPFVEAKDDKDKSIMDYESVLPEEFEGVFYFTNPSDEDFTAKWDGIEYLFPAQKTVPILMEKHSPLEIQHIRKKFAKDLAEREFFKGNKYEQFRLREGTKDEMGVVQPRAHGMSHAGQYTLNDLTPYIQACLKPMEKGKLTAKAAEKVNVEQKLNRDDDGKLVTEAIDSKTSLEQKALQG